MTLLLVLHDDLLFHYLSFIFVLKSYQHKAKASAALSLLLSHHNCVVHSAVLREILVKVVFVSREG